MNLQWALQMQNINQSMHSKEWLDNFFYLNVAKIADHKFVGVHAINPIQNIFFVFLRSEIIFFLSCEELEWEWLFAHRHECCPIFFSVIIQIDWD